MAAVRVTTAARRAVAATKKPGGGKGYLKGGKRQRKLNIYSTHYNRINRYFSTISFENLFQQYLQMEALLYNLQQHVPPQLTIIQGKIKKQVQ
jgi:hypothetical protein